MFAGTLKAYVLFGGIEPGPTLAASTALEALRGCGVRRRAHAVRSDEQLKSVAHVMLPIGTFAETSGTYVNLEGLWQSFAGAAKPLGEARPGWKVLRVLGNLLDVPGFDYQSRKRCATNCAALMRRSIAASRTSAHASMPRSAASPRRASSTCRMYRVDARGAPRAVAAGDARRPAARRSQGGAGA